MKKVTRRDFLKVVSAGVCGSALHRVLAPCNSFMAFAEPGVGRALGPSPVFILVNLAGGASYNVTPLYNGAYYDLNPTISYDPATSIALTPEQGLHPALIGFQQIWNEGNLALINMVGYPNPNRSHDESTRIWHSGVRSTIGGAAGGWAAKLTCQMSESLFAGVSLAGANTLTQGDCNPPRAFGDLTNFGEDRYSWNDGANIMFRDTRTRMMLDANPAANDEQVLVRKAIDNVEVSVDTIRNATAGTLPVTFPNSSFGNACRDAAKLLAAPQLLTRFIYLEIGGFDTHSGERTRLTQLLTDLNAGLTALITMAKQLGRWQDVCICTMSEFCRTFENDSAGTDHGHSGPMFLCGGGISGGIKSPVPSAGEMTNGYFHNYYVDFRQIFREIVAGMGKNPDIVFPEPISYTSLNLFT